jgi:hypothetical protein
MNIKTEKTKSYFRGIPQHIRVAALSQLVRNSGEERMASR